MSTRFEELRRLLAEYTQVRRARAVRAVREMEDVVDYSEDEKPDDWEEVRMVRPTDFGETWWR